MKQIRLFFILSIFFTGVVFLFKNYFFSGIILDKSEESYLEYTVPNNRSEVQLEVKSSGEVSEKLQYKYIPDQFQGEIPEYTRLFTQVLHDDIFLDKILNLQAEFYKDKVDVRGRMKEKTIKVFGVLMMDSPEFLGVVMHEFAHYIDLYYLDKKVTRDISQDFYDHSWLSAKILLPGQKQADFVSGYAMTNKYEDFGESFIYYVFHNKDFLEKSLHSEVLKSKYDFFGKYLFKANDFQQTDFSESNEVKNYYRDITKINFNLENFLQYLQK